MRDNLKLLLSVLVRILLPKSAHNIFILFRNDGGRIWKVRKKSYLVKS
jgi:hypothetical protein